MAWIASKIRWILLVSGVLTCTMVHAAVAPDAALRSMFGASLDGPVANVVVRSWGALIALVGVMLIYGAYRPEARALVLLVAGASKLTFIALVLASGRQFLAHQAGVAIVVDAGMVLLFACYFVGRRKDLTGKGEEGVG